MKARGISVNNQKGLVLQSAIIFLVAIALLGSTAVVVTTTDLKIGGNYKVSEQAFYAAEAGIEEARTRLRLPTSDSNHIKDPVSGYDAMWSVYILTDGSWQATDDRYYDSNLKNYIPHASSQTSVSINANSIQTAISYFVKMRYKREYDAEQVGHTTTSSHYYDDDGSTSTHTAASPGNIVYYGYGDPGSPTTPTQFTTSASTIHKPVILITSYGTSGGSLRIIETEVIFYPGPPIKSPLYAKGNVTGNGTALSVDGSDNCGTAPSLPPIYTLSPATTTLSGSPTTAGNPAAPVAGPDDINITQYVNALKSTATELITSDQSGINYGSAGNHVVCYSDTSDPYNVGGLKLQNTVGYGVLLVEGDLTLGGGFDWNGVILCTGVLTFNGGGNTINIRGAVLGNQTVTINGSLDIRYDSCMIDDALNTQSRKLISWRQIY